MDIEHLNKSQIILLTLLVSFVTSIATGIVTVTLVQQAPPGVTQTINRIVERTVEKVVPVMQTAGVAQAPPPQKTIVIKEKDLMAQALEAVRPAVVRLYTNDKDNPTFLALGLVLNVGGVIVTDSSGIGDNVDAVVVQQGGSRVRSFVRRRDEDTGLAYLFSATTTVDGKPVIWSSAPLSRDKALLGASVFTLGGKETTRISDGIITAIDASGAVDTSITGPSILAGGTLFDTDGNVIGVMSGASRAISEAVFVPVSAVSIEPSAGKAGAPAAATK